MAAVSLSILATGASPTSTSVRNLHEMHERRRATGLHLLLVAPRGANIRASTVPGRDHDRSATITRPVAMSFSTLNVSSPYSG